MKIASITMIGIVFAGVFFTACIGNQLDVEMSDSTSTADSFAMPVSETASITSLPTVLTATTATVPSPASFEGSTLFEEPFTDNHNNWYTDETLAAVMDGKYLHILDCPDASPASQCGNFVKIPFTFPNNFRLQVEATLTESSDGGSVMFGIQVRKSDEGYYYINYLPANSSYEMSRITQTGEFSILPATQTDFINTAMGDTNILGVEAHGAEFTLLVNSQKLPSIQDGNIPTAGDSYLVVLVDRGHSAEVQFDNLVVEKFE